MEYVAFVDDFQAVGMSLLNAFKMKKLWKSPVETSIRTVRRGVLGVCTDGTKGGDGDTGIAEAEGGPCGFHFILFGLNRLNAHVGLMYFV